MDVEQQGEWRDLERRAVETLRGGCGTGSRVVQVLILPSFEPATSWDLLRSGSDSQARFTTQFTRWRRDLDQAKLLTPIERLRHPRTLLPTLEGRAYDLPPGFGNTVLAEISRLSIPPIAEEEHFGLDGASYELAFGSGFVTARYRWWLAPPPGWADLGRFAEWLIEELERITGQASG